MPRSTKPAAHRESPPRRANATGNGPGRSGEGRSRRKRGFKFFYRVAEILQQVLPAKLPVVVRLGSPGPYCNGYCRRLKSQFHICIQSGLSEEFTTDVLIHEYAHALAWPRKRDLQAAWCMPRTQRQRPYHGSNWGKAYAQVYCAVAFDIAPEVRRELRAARRHKERSRRK